MHKKFKQFKRASDCEFSIDIFLSTQSKWVWMKVHNYLSMKPLNSLRISQVIIFPNNFRQKSSPWRKKIRNL